MKISTTLVAASFIIFIGIVESTALPEQNPDLPATAIFSEVRVEGKWIEQIKGELRTKLPTAHVRRIISGAESDQTLMVMYHPKGNFRAAINDYFRVLDPMPGVLSTQTYIGTAMSHPEEFPTDYLLGWMFVKLDSAVKEAHEKELENTFRRDPAVLEVVSLTGAYDLVIVYKFDGSSVYYQRQAANRLRNFIGSEPATLVVMRNCP